MLKSPMQLFTKCMLSADGHFVAVKSTQFKNNVKYKRLQ